MSVIVLDKQRVLLKRIKNYGLNHDEIYYRNDRREERFLLLFLMNEDELWSEYKFEYLSIKLLSGKEHKYYSDKKLCDILKKMNHYFEKVGIDGDVEECSYHCSEDYYEVSETLQNILEQDEHLAQAVESYIIIRDTFVFVEEDISALAIRMDHAFGKV